MENFDAACALIELADGSFSWDIPDGWHVGRGAWGGLVAGALVRAVTTREDERARVVRSVSAEFAAPARVGPHTITATRLRRGSTLSTWNVVAVDGEGGPVARLTAVVAEARPSAADIDVSSWGMLPPPPAPDAADVPVVAIEPPLGPEFGRQVEFRPVTGLPYSGPSARALRYGRLKDTVPHTAASLLGLVDAWWPATLAMLDRVRPIATVNFSANLMVDPATIAADELLLYEGTAAGAADGFTSEQRRLWAADGRLVVDNLQSIVLIA